jgi:hypothetical protein
VLDVETLDCGQHTPPLAQHYVTASMEQIDSMTIKSDKEIDDGLREAQWKLEGRCMNCGWKEYRTESYILPVRSENDGSRRPELRSLEPKRHICIRCETVRND